MPAIMNLPRSSSELVRPLPACRVWAMKAHAEALLMRALVTRPRAEAEALAALLARRGIEMVIEPLIEIEASGAVLPDLAGAQAVLCTSATGARALARASGERGVPAFAGREPRRRCRGSCATGAASVAARGRATTAHRRQRDGGRSRGIARRRWL